MRFLPQIILTLLTCFIFAAPTFALDLGTDITIDDGNSSSDSGWYGPDEDDEVEPGMVKNQVWDLEGFFQQHNTLSLVGGFNFKDGEDDFTSGDIFISRSKPDFGEDNSGETGTVEVTKTYGYEYVLDLDFDKETYAVFGLDADTVLQKAHYPQNEGSSPWKYVGGGIETVFGGTFSFDSGLTDKETGFSGDDSHYLLTGFDLSFLGHGTDFYSHFTMGCGNDNLMGQSTVVPEPSTYILFAVGGGLALWARRKKK